MCLSRHLCTCCCGRSHNPPMCCGPLLCPAASGHESPPHGLRFGGLCYLSVSFSVLYTRSGAHIHTQPPGDISQALDNPAAGSPYCLTWSKGRHPPDLFHEVRVNEWCADQQLPWRKLSHVLYLSLCLWSEFSSLLLLKCLPSLGLLSQDFRGDPVVKNLPADAGVMGSIPGLGISHVPQGNWACTPLLLSPHALAPTLCHKRSPRTEKAQAQQWRPSTAKNQSINSKKDVF